MYFMTSDTFMHKLNYVSHGSLTALELDNSSVNLVIIDIRQGVPGVFLWI